MPEVVSHPVPPNQSATRRRTMDLWFVFVGYSVRGSHTKIVFKL